MEFLAEIAKDTQLNKYKFSIILIPPTFEPFNFDYLGEYNSPNHKKKKKKKTSNISLFSKSCHSSCHLRCQYARSSSEISSLYGEWQTYTAKKRLCLYWKEESKDTIGPYKI
jgi:hypothetical protein